MDATRINQIERWSFGGRVAHYRYVNRTGTCEQTHTLCGRELKTGNRISRHQAGRTCTNCFRVLESDKRRVEAGLLHP